VTAMFSSQKMTARVDFVPTVHGLMAIFATPTRMCVYGSGDANLRPGVSKQARTRKR
jgi:hypothetical protein